MSDILTLSVKPDKCHLLKSTVDQIQQLRRREQGEGGGARPAGPGLPNPALTPVSLPPEALLSPDDEVQKSDISSSSQGLVEREALGPVLLEVRARRRAAVGSRDPGLRLWSSRSARLWTGSSSLSTGRVASSLCRRT